MLLLNSELKSLDNNEGENTVNSHQSEDDPNESLHCRVSGFGEFDDAGENEIHDNDRRVGLHKFRNEVSQAHRVRDCRYIP